jgi:proteic killer suppression protein
MAIRSYHDRGTRDIAAGMNSKAARRRLAFLAAAVSLDDLRARPGMNLHALSGDRTGEFAIRINDQYRICFVWNAGDVEVVEITDYH